MKFTFNVKKREVIAIVAVIFLVGFVIAQTPPNPGHIASQVNIGGIVNDDLQDWAVATENRVDALEASSGSVAWTSPWTFSNPISNSPYYSANLISSLSAGVTTHAIPASIPVTAKEVLVYAYIARGANGGASSPIDITIYTYDGTYYANRLSIIDNNNNAWNTNSDNFWLPVTTYREISVHLPSSLSGNVFSGLQIIGYR